MRWQVWSVDRVLSYLQENHIFLHYSENGVELWTCGRKMPQALRRSIYKHRQLLASLLRSGSSLVCPSPKLHRRYWRKAGPGCEKVCEMCLQLDSSGYVEGKTA